MRIKQTKAEKREDKKKKKVAKTSGTLAGQSLKLKTNKGYRGDIKKM